LIKYEREPDKGFYKFRFNISGLETQQKYYKSDNAKFEVIELIDL